MSREETGRNGEKQKNWSNISQTCHKAIPLTSLKFFKDHLYFSSICLIKMILIKLSLIKIDLIQISLIKMSLIKMSLLKMSPIKMSLIK